MKTALVTTTINVPHVLRLYRRADPNVRFFIAADQKTNLPVLEKVCQEIGNAEWDFKVDDWKSHPLIGWNCIQRRNIATLEALRWGADVIVFVDDDNIPIHSARYFRDYQEAFIRPHSGLMASPETEWYDTGQQLDPPTPHRGFPHQYAHRKPRLSHVVDAKIGVAAGLVLGDPDCSALTRITVAPHVTSMSAAGVFGVAVNPKFTRTVFNTQNSAVLRELAPAMLLCPQFLRYDDIIASLVCQRVMADTGHHVWFGPPFVYQERNAHDLSRDLADEAWGQENILKVQSLLWRTAVEPDHSVGFKVRVLYTALDELMPGVAVLCDAWLEDCERAMS